MPRTSLDIKWIEEYKASGDLAALGELYEPYMVLVYGLALKYLKDEDASKDAVMQVFEILIEKVKTQEIRHFKSWLYMLSKNYCLMQLRKEQKNIHVEITEEFMESEPFLHHEEGLLREQKISTMEKCMETLIKEQRISLSLFYIQQKCYADVSKQSGYDIKKVKSYIQNGKRNLKICIERNSE